jgi:hypothetical protein
MPVPHGIIVRQVSVVGPLLLVWPSALPPVLGQLITSAKDKDEIMSAMSIAHATLNLIYQKSPVKIRLELAHEYRVSYSCGTDGRRR